MTSARLTINSRNYGAWSLRGWLLCRFSGLDVEIDQVSGDDESSRAELMMLSPSFRVPRLEHDGAEVWGILSIAEYLNEVRPDAGLLPAGRLDRARCRSVCSEVMSGFTNLRTTLPMNLRARNETFPLWQGARADLDRILTIWTECLDASGGSFLFGAAPTMADALYAPECTRLRSYGISVPEPIAAYREAMLTLPEMVEWAALARDEPAEFEELDVEV